MEPKIAYDDDVTEEQVRQIEELFREEFERGDWVIESDRARRGGPKWM